MQEISSLFTMFIYPCIPTYIYVVNLDYISNNILFTLSGNIYIKHILGFWDDNKESNSF